VCMNDCSDNKKSATELTDKNRAVYVNSVRSVAIPGNTSQFSCITEYATRRVRGCFKKTKANKV
jgi:hypothetical protein